MTVNWPLFTSNQLSHVRFFLRHDGRAGAKGIPMADKAIFIAAIQLINSLAETDGDENVAVG